MATFSHSIFISCLLLHCKLVSILPLKITLLSWKGGPWGDSPMYIIYMYRYIFMCLHMQLYIYICIYRFIVSTVYITYITCHWPFNSNVSYPALLASWRPVTSQGARGWPVKEGQLELGVITGKSPLSLDLTNWHQRQPKNMAIRNQMQNKWRSNCCRFN